MKYLLIIMVMITMVLAQGKYGYGNIDMHGGKGDSITGEKSNNFANKNIEMSNFLDDKKIIKEKKDLEKKEEEKVKIYK